MSRFHVLIPMTLSAFLLAASAPPAHATSYNKCGNGTLNQGEQCDDGNTTSGDGCQSNCRVQDGYECTGSPSVCAPEAEVDCGDGIVDEGEDCDGGACCTTECTYRPSTTTCRGAAGVCDAAEKCTGASSTCPADQLKPSTTICRAAVPDCIDEPEYCTGTSVDCPPGSAPTCGNGVVD
ncbi:MAG: hypothetical protein LC667_16645, partial [Thioalkalivibrio sp.]|nr:hypothetical protein [Thioalkalivibrio sp.]